jgi:hypothetical protein
MPKADKDNTMVPISAPPHLAKARATNMPPITKRVLFVIFMIAYQPSFGLPKEALSP